MSGKLALVTGATGAIGPALVNHLAANGYTVRTYSRHSPAPNVLLPGVEHLQGDINDAEALSRALNGVDVVFHLAALLHIENPPPQMTSLYQAVNITGTQHVVSLSRQAGVKRLVYFSTVKVYGIHQRQPVDEDTPLSPKTFYAQTKLQGEQVVRAAQGLETVVLRLSAVYGPRLRGSWERMVKAIERGWFIPVGRLQNRRSLTYVDDMACAARFVAEHPSTPGNTYNVVGHEDVTMREILSAIYRVLDRPLPPVRLPAFVALPGVFVVEKGLELLGKRSPLTMETFQQLVSDEVYSGEKLRRLGLQTFVPLDQGWRKTIAQTGLGAGMRASS
ncbi:MAG: NAD-dependent epimerase/dehydratase family protein [Aggregatilineales bacterium]